MTENQTPDTPAGQVAPEGPKYTDADMANARRKAEKAAADAAAEAARLKTELDGLKAQAMTEQEKAIAKAREEAATQVRTELEGQFNSERIGNGLRLALAERGLPASLAPSVQAAGGISGVDDITGALDSFVQANPWTANLSKQPPPPGQHGAPSGPTPAREWTPAAIAAATKDELKQHWSDIQAAIAKQMGT